MGFNKNETITYKTYRRLALSCKVVDISAFSLVC